MLSTLDIMRASSVRGAERPWESFIPNWFFSHLLPPSCEPEYGRKTSGRRAYVWFFFNFPFLFVYGERGGGGRFIWLFTQIYYAPVYFVSACVRICGTQVQWSVYTHSARDPRAWTATGLPAPAALAQAEGLCYFLKTLLGRFPSLSWQHFLMSNNPRHQETVFPFFKINTLRLHFTVLLFLCNQRGWEELVRHFLTLNKHSYPQKSLINGPTLSLLHSELSIPSLNASQVLTAQAFMVWPFHKIHIGFSAFPRGHGSKNTTQFTAESGSSFLFLRGFYS